MDPSALICDLSKIVLLGMINFLSIVVISIGDKSKTFSESNELISLSKAEVHFSGVGILDMDLGMAYWSRLDSMSLFGIIFIVMVMVLM